jgi:phosphoribosylformylglycinamidine cyclo-ligase
MDEREMLTTFNCGIGMIAVVAANAADNVMLALAEQGEEAVVLGEVVACGDNDPQVIFSGALEL